MFRPIEIGWGVTVGFGSYALSCLHNKLFNTCISQANFCADPSRDNLIQFFNSLNITTICYKKYPDCLNLRAKATQIIQCPGFNYLKCAQDTLLHPTPQNMQTILISCAVSIAFVYALRKFLQDRLA